jgi:hypothetical protein
MIIIPKLYCPLRLKAYQPTAGLTFTFLHTEVKDHLAILGVTCGHHVEAPAIVVFLDQDYS